MEFIVMSARTKGFKAPAIATLGLVAVVLIALGLVVTDPAVGEDGDPDAGTIFLPGVFHTPWPGGGGGGGGDPSGITAPGATSQPGADPDRRRTLVSLAIDALAKFIKVASTELYAGVQIVPDSLTDIVVSHVGKGSAPRNPDVHMVVTAPVGDELRVVSDERTVMIDGHQLIATTLGDLFSGVVSFEMLGGAKAITGQNMIVIDGIDGYDAPTLLDGIRAGAGELRVLQQNPGRLSLTDLLVQAQNAGFFDEYHDRLGVVLIGYDDLGARVSVVSVIVDIDEGSISLGDDCPVTVEVHAKS